MMLISTVIVSPGDAAIVLLPPLPSHSRLTLGAALAEVASAIAIKLVIAATAKVRISSLLSFFQ
jgi:membrane protein DedA with SNARE-associated domain